MSDEKIDAKRRAILLGGTALAIFRNAKPSLTLGGTVGAAAKRPIVFTELPRGLYFSELLADWGDILDPDEDIGYYREKFISSERQLLSIIDPGKKRQSGYNLQLRDVSAHNCFMESYVDSRMERLTIHAKDTESLLSSYEVRSYFF